MGGLTEEEDFPSDWAAPSWSTGQIQRPQGKAALRLPACPCLLVSASKLLPSLQLPSLSEARTQLTWLSNVKLGTRGSPGILQALQAQLMDWAASKVSPSATCREPLLE